MLGLRQKLLLGFGGLLAILLLIGVQSIWKISELGESIDMILRENYRSVIATQQMKEALERIDSGLLFELLGHEPQGAQLIEENLKNFDSALRVELDNITLPGEEEACRNLETLYGNYRAVLGETRDANLSRDARVQVYFSKLFPVFREIKSAADRVLQMNQRNMSDANDRARRKAAQTRQRMYLLLLCGTLVAFGFMGLAGRWILDPLKRLIDSANEIRQGNLDLVVKSGSTDEIGQLSNAFDAMAASLREFRRSDRSRMAHIQRATQQALDSLPDAVAVIDAEGNVEAATALAGEAFGLKPGASLKALSQEWIATLYEEVLRTGHAVEGKGEFAVVRCPVRGAERFFRPKGIPVPDGTSQAAGATLLFQDITQARRRDELEQGPIAAVCRQLEPPLTSLRTAAYLLLGERVGPLMPKQEELLAAIREDGERLYEIVEDLHNIGRYYAGRVEMEFRTAPPDTLVREALERFAGAARNRGVLLVGDIPAELPGVLVDISRIRHVFDNLLSNVLRDAPSGGQITVSARAETEFVVFSIEYPRRSDFPIGPSDTASVGRDLFPPSSAGTNPALCERSLRPVLAAEIVKAHGGVFEARDAEGKRSEFVLGLRRADSATDAPPQEKQV